MSTKREAVGQQPGQNATVPGLSEAAIRAQAAAESFARGQQYYQRGAVIDLVRRGGELRAAVEGSEYAPYQVQIAFDAGGISSATCSCPYEWGGWCKHIVAVLLACLYNPEEIEERPPLEEQLAALGDEELRALLLNLAARIPGLVVAIETQIALLRSRPDTGAGQEVAPARRTPVDPQPIRRQVRAALHSMARMGYRDDYEDAGGMPEELEQFLDRAREFTVAGDGRNALAILEAITAEYVAQWAEIEDSYGYAGDFFAELAGAWIEALLTADLDAVERRQWDRKLGDWQRQATEYGTSDDFEMARAAALQGWDYPPLRRVLAGEITEKGAWEDEAPDYADELAISRLAVLERQGRYQEYLYLAEAEGQLDLYVLMLVRLGRVQEALKEGLAYLTTADEALRVATAMRERGELEPAMRIAEHGLKLAGPAQRLAEWLSDLSGAIGDRAAALRYGQIAFRAAPSLAGYLKLQDLAGERWEQVRAGLLKHLRQDTTFPAYPRAHIDIFLHEGLIDDAIGAVGSATSYDLLERVMDAAIEQRPEWVIRNARRQAERIMDAGQAQHYDHAVEWLRRVRAASEVAGREAEWRAYLADLRSRHGRKYKLMGLLARM